jgi:hypothetical protein
MVRFRRVGAIRCVRTSAPNRLGDDAVMVVVWLFLLFRSTMRRATGSLCGHIGL